MYILFTAIKLYPANGEGSYFLETLAVCVRELIASQFMKASKFVTWDLVL